MLKYIYYLRPLTDPFLPLSHPQEHCGFNWPWSFFLACKSASCDENFYKNEAQINIAVHQNIRRTKSKKPALKHFDGAIMSGYQLPSIHWEHLFCRNRGEDQTSCADMFPRDEDQVLMANVDIPTGFEKALGGKDVVRNEMATAAVKTKEAMDAKMVPFLGKWNPMISRKASHKYMTA
uniref:Uncharacterized protein n=1 Tax=Corethron hystrix TaxID=216773 RepID=A0A7S1B9C8_9STRA|mmetsp:Transcript_18037/g.41023  ORF Transcript_18037/g.41023 Transcript_18037/m.41023 type:complete len:178 (+) Transcript_18037:35-568(+)